MKLRLIIVSSFCFIASGLQAAHGARATADRNAQAVYPHNAQVAPREAYANANFGNAQAAAQAHANAARASATTATIAHNNARAGNFRP